MKENLNIDKDYKKVFNQSYALARDLNLKSPIFERVDPTNINMQALQDGMNEYSNEVAVKEKISLEKYLNPKTNRNSKNTHTKKDKRKGFDLSN